MRVSIFFLLICFLIIGCNSDSPNQTTPKTTEEIAVPDTNVISIDLMDNIGGSMYLSRAVGYKVAIDKDTSEYTCVFSQSKETGRIEMDLNFSKVSSSVLFNRRISELKIILQKADKDFNLDSLQTISFGRLVHSGDLAIEISNQYKNTMGFNNKTPKYSEVCQFLKTSILVSVVDSLLEPYSFYTTGVSIEKFMLTEKKYFLPNQIIETDTSLIPDSLIDAIVWVNVKRKRN
ncbi:MAG: hypothetical protein IT232_03080 [Flavobacteriales bacterium]|nr:hypothetical protein [Flavobacteriales bacterium]